MKFDLQIARNKLKKITQSKFIALEGKNFSGRSDFLRGVTQIEHNSVSTVSVDVEKTKQTSAYVGPEVYNAISGLSPTVEGEIKLNSLGSKYSQTVSILLKKTGFELLRDRNPFTLSGGEQALLAIISAIASTPRFQAIDCVFEQISHKYVNLLVETIKEEACSWTTFFIADNRLDEYENIKSNDKIPIQNLIDITPISQNIEPINPMIDLSILYESSFPISIRNLEFRYAPGAPVLRDVSVDLYPSTPYILVGKNGAGKSTLAKLLSGILLPDSGQIFLNGSDYFPWKHPGQMVGYHFQNPDLQLFSTTVEEEVAAGPKARNLPEEEIFKRKSKLMTTFGLTNLAKEHPLELPFTIRKRVALAATLAMGCPWYVLDEPTLGQDEESSKSIIQIIHRMIDNGIGIVIISHSQWLQNELSSIILWLKEGTLMQ